MYIHLLRSVLIAFCFFVGVFLPCGASAEPAVGDRARNFRGFDIIGRETVELEDYRGQWVFVEFWASWCGPCVRELPNMIRGTKPYVDSGRLKVITIAKDDAGTLPDLKRLIRQHHLSYPVLFDDDDESFYQSIIAQEWGISSVPSSYLINPEGVIVAGDPRGDKLAGTLDYYMNHLRPVMGLSGSMTVNDDYSITVKANVMNPGLEPVTVDLYAFKLKLVWDEEQEKYIEDHMYCDELLGSKTIEFNEFCEGDCGFLIPADDELYYTFCVLKAVVPGTEHIGTENPGIRLTYQSAPVTLLDVEFDDENGYSVHGPKVEYH